MKEIINSSDLGYNFLSLWRQKKWLKNFIQSTTKNIEILLKIAGNQVGNPAKKSNKISPIYPKYKQ